MEKENKELVIRLLKKNKEGLLIIDIAKKLKLSRNTIRVILAEFKGAKLIRVRLLGKYKLNYWIGEGK